MKNRGFRAGSVRWLKRLGLGLLVLVVGATAVGTIYEFHARNEAHRNYPPRGQMVDIGGRKMHLDCRGTGSPTVVLESGLDTFGSLAWDKVQDDLGRLTRTCSYDRAGVMWSEPKSTPQDAIAVAEDLHATLTSAGIGGSLVMVGHSLGGPYIMTYTRKYPEQVKGLVFVDCSHPDQMERMPENVQKAMRVPLAYKVLSAISWTGVFQIIPDPPVPGMPERIRPIGKAYMGETVGASLKEMMALATILQQGGELRDLGDRPLVVLTAMQPIPDDLLASQGLTPQDGKDMQAVWDILSAEEASWSSRSRRQVVPDSMHYIQYQRPDLVIAAVGEVVDAVRADGRRVFP